LDVRLSLFVKYSNYLFLNFEIEHLVFGSLRLWVFIFFFPIWNQIWGVLLSQNISVQTLHCGKQFVIFMWKCNQAGSCKNEVADKKRKRVPSRYVCTSKESLE